MKNSLNEDKDNKTADLFLLESELEALQKVRVVSLFGDLDEESLGNIFYLLVNLKETAKQKIITEVDGEEKIETIVRPIDFYISTWGGDALGMLALYDLMRLTKEECDIGTFGAGKVMSAGVLLLAAGTKGKRKIGRHTRVMLHAVRAGHFGALHSLENEMKETKWIQEQYVNALVTETKMTKRYVKKLMNQKMDVYFDAEEAIKLGIADIIV
tara:strand:- start:7223 stop:7861 length:639 start_codon:yes stop_codon:yes gene_type:complete